jgi:hypothetical protein
VKLLSLALLFLACVCPGLTQEKSVPSIDTVIAALPHTGLTRDQDALVLARFIEHAQAFAITRTDESIAESLREHGPERFCWVDFSYLNCLNIAYQLTSDTQHLDRFRDSFSAYINSLSRGQDGFLGWYGKTLELRQLPDQPDLEVDELQTNFRAIGILSTWIELARGQTAYAERNAETIAAYLDLMEQHFFPKWDKRGHFVLVPGRGGTYRALDYPRTIEVSLSFEKLSIMVDALLRLHRVTGSDTYLKRALQIGAWFKSHLILQDEHYEWMSWVPSGPWDVSPTGEDRWTVNWMAPDPNGTWYVASLSIALNLYQHGLLFDDMDLARFIRTQREQCWNGDLEEPVYRRVSGDRDQWTRGRFLSYSIAHYDEALKTLAFAGPHESQALNDTESSWKGGANAQSYIVEKYLIAPIIEATPQPFAAVGQTFLSNDGNQPFYDLLNKEVHEPGSIPARRPSDLFAVPPDTSPTE